MLASGDATVARCFGRAALAGDIPSIDQENLTERCQILSKSG